MATHTFAPPKIGHTTRANIGIVIFLMFYVLLPATLAFALRHRHPVLELVIFYLTTLTISAVILKRYARKKYALDYQYQTIEERINLCEESIAAGRAKQDALAFKKSRYDSLKKIIEDLNTDLSLDHVAETLSSIAYSLIAASRGVCILALINPGNQQLGVFKTKKESPETHILDKGGDVFDHWVLRHSSPILIEDAGSDFRFDIDRIHPSMKRSVAALISAPLLSQDSFLGLMRLDHPTAHFYSQDDLRFLATLCDIGVVSLQNCLLYQKTQDLAIHDELTGLYTKAHFNERLKEEAKRSLRHKTSFSLFMLDVDLFKSYNDRFGHTMGDIVLKKIARHLEAFCRDSGGIAGRFGGEEFSVILPSTGKDAACAVAEKLRIAIEQDQVVLRRQTMSVTVSIGVAIFPDVATDEVELMHKADKALYEAKSAGRNRVCCS